MTPQTSSFWRYYALIMTVTAGGGRPQRKSDINGQATVDQISMSHPFFFVNIRHRGAGDTISTDTTTFVTMPDTSITLSTLPEFQMATTPIFSTMPDLGLTPYASNVCRR
jgi:hypothetical protein